MEIRIEDIGMPPVPFVADDGQLSEASAQWHFLRLKSLRRKRSVERWRQSFAASFRSLRN